MSTKTRWERFCDWLSGPEAPEMKSAYPCAPEPIRPFVAKLVACLDVGDYKNTLPGGFGNTSYRFVLAEDLDVTIYVRDWDDENPYVNCFISGAAHPLANAERAAIFGGIKRVNDRLKDEAARGIQTAQAQAIAKIEAYIPKAP